MRAPGSGTAGRSARAGLVLLQSPAFRKAYIIRRREEGWGSGRSLGFQRFLGPWFLEGSRDPSFVIIMMGGLKFCLLGKFWFFYFRSLLQRAWLAGSGAQPPRLHFSQFPCNHLILVSPPSPPTPSQLETHGFHMETNFFPLTGLDLAASLSQSAAAASHDVTRC